MGGAVYTKGAPCSRLGSDVAVAGGAHQLYDEAESGPVPITKPKKPKALTPPITPTNTGERGHLRVAGG